MAHPAEELDVVALEAHAGAAAEPEAAAGQLGADLVDVVIGAPPGAPRR